MAVASMDQQLGEFGFLQLGLVLLVAAVLSVPVARRLGLPAIVAYLIAGFIIGPFWLCVFAKPPDITPVAQLLLTAAVIGALVYATHLAGWRGALVAGLALAMSTTAIALQIMEQRGELQ